MSGIWPQHKPNDSMGQGTSTLRRQILTLTVCSQKAFGAVKFAINPYIFDLMRWLPAKFIRFIMEKSVMGRIWYIFVNDLHQGTVMKVLNNILLWVRVPSTTMEGDAYLNGSLLSSTICYVSPLFFSLWLPFLDNPLPRTAPLAVMTCCILISPLAVPTCTYLCLPVFRLCLPVPGCACGSL